MRTLLVDPRTDPLWQALIEKYQSDVFHSPAWMQVLFDTYGLEPCACLLLDDQESPVAGVPFCEIHDIRGARRVSLPFSDYCDPLVQEPEHWSILTEQLLAEPMPFVVRCLRNEIPLADSRFMIANRAKWHGLDLHADLNTLWMHLHSSARRAIQKGQQQGVTVEIAQDIDDLRHFFEMHLGLRKHKYRMLAQPYQFFVNIWRHFVETQRGALMVARDRDRIIGATLFLEWRETLVYKFNASLPNALEFRPNDLIIWQAMQYAKSKGFTALDFGLSDWDQDGLVRFKRKFATEERTIFFLQHAPKSPTDYELQIRRLLPQLTGLFTDESVPDNITEKAGEILYRYFV